MFVNKIKFTNSDTWNSVMKSLQSLSYPLYVEELFQSAMLLTQYDQITVENWTEFARILSVTDTSQFKEKLYFTNTDVGRIQFILDEVCALTNITDQTYFEILESKVINELTVKIEDLSQNIYEQINHIRFCNFNASNNLNQTILDMLNNISINLIIMENLIKWLIQKMTNFKGVNDTIFSLMMCADLLSLVSACVQKEDYLYRKITNSQNFNKFQMIKLLEKILNNHPYFPARGSAFILVSAMDQSDHKVIINAMNTLFDENLVKAYSMIGIPLIHLSPNEFYVNSKSKIINYLAKEIGQLKSEKPVNYYYADIKIPFTTTLENELYKAWIKIQGLSGKTQYSINVEKSIELY